MTKDGPFWLVACAVGSGAALGAILRWALSYALNARIEQIPLGTLAANWLGGYLIGLAAAGLASHPAVSPAARLFIVTGFLGGLTTFSTFSSEAVAMLGAAQYGRAALHVLLHTGGSFAMTALGLLSWQPVSAFFMRLF